MTVRSGIISRNHILPLLVSLNETEKRRYTMSFATRVKGNSAGSSSCASLIILSKHNRKKSELQRVPDYPKFRSRERKEMKTAESKPLLPDSVLQLHPPCVLRRSKLNFGLLGSIQFTSALASFSFFSFSLCHPSPWALPFAFVF